MTTLDVPGSGGPDTHEVTNQPPLVGHDVASDPVLLAGVEREGAGWATEDLHRLGRLAGSEQAQLWASRRAASSPSCARTTGTAPASTRSRSTRRGTR